MRAAAALPGVTPWPGLILTWTSMLMFTMVASMMLDWVGGMKLADRPAPESG